MPYPARNIHESSNGLIDLIKDISGRDVEYTNLSRIGNSMKRMARHKEIIPENQDIIVLHLGAMDLMRKTSIGEFKKYTGEVLDAITVKNPEALIIVINLSDMIYCLTRENNRNRIIVK